ncbi:uncharacterized protein LOC125492319 [Beta vulgaris subsp. vulgaris]|uniref:uncharacterized protein LOC125492319 n=1 Tax=Beta vulgaris subsp. vulgaris TaxID=3555 RepID=UPI00254969A6|nr:uncharacterized protein LOC125492319 [Beta vulgaris subsp. vulgaris]
MGDEAPPKSLREYAMPDETTTTINRPTTAANHLSSSHNSSTWQRYKALQRQCPHHGIPEWLLIQTFYNGLKHEVRSSIDAASGGTFMAKTPEAAKTLLDDMAANNYLNDWSISRGAPKKGGKYEVDAIATLSNTVQVLAAKVDQLSSRSIAPVCEICEVQGHSFNECQYNTMGAVTEQANALLNTNTRPQNNPYSNTYNPGWKNHPNFSYKNNQPQPPPTNYSQPPGFQQRPPFSSSSSSTSNLETIIENLASSQAKQIEYQAKQNDFFNNSLQQIHAHNKMMENQMTQLAQQISHLSKPSGQLPGQTEPNPKGHINAISLRSGKELPEPTRRVTEQKNTAKEVIELSEEVQGKTGLEEEAKETEKKEPIVTPIAPYKPPVPFPQRLAQAKLEKKKIEENVTVSLTAECSAILQNKLPKKLGDPGSYSIPVKLGDIEIKNALCDLGASVSLMPLSICKKLNMGELKPTRISLQLADRTVKFPLGILEDVPLRVGKFLIPCDFVVMEMEEDANVPIILGRPFLATAEAIIDMKKGKITFEIGDEKMEYTLTNSKASPSMGES